MNKAKKIIKELKNAYPDAKCSLDFNTPFEMVVSVMLSAQCTDARVNKTTPSIFSKYTTPEDFASIELEELERLIHPCGFYKNKAKNIKACAKTVVEKYRWRSSKKYKGINVSSRNWKKKCKCSYVGGFWTSRRNSSRYSLQKNSK